MLKRLWIFGRGFAMADERGYVLGSIWKKRGGMGGMV